MEMYTFTIPREEFNELRPNKQMLRTLISSHISKVDHLKKNMAYYQGKHDILNDKNRENKLVCNHAKDISDTASSYFIGNPVSYKSESDITDLTDALENAGADEVDGDNGLELSIYGLAYEYIYTKEDETYLNMKNVSAENTFMVKDDSIEENELFAVYYYVKKDDSNVKPDHFMATVLTQNYKFELDILNDK
ncbi:MAG: phage portal protein, partial [Blautia obeum]|nr:phage portal protein [Blautia obeum]